MAPRFIFAILSISFGIAVIIATITTARHLSHRSDISTARNSSPKAPPPVSANGKTARSRILSGGLVGAESHPGPLALRSLQTGGH
jgi:hypothetical protein